MTYKTPEPPVPDSTRQKSAGQLSVTYGESLPPQRTITPHLPPAALIDVLIDQIEYLMDHADGCCPGCADCIRWEQAKHQLLLPFLEVTAFVQR